MRPCSSSWFAEEVQSHELQLRAYLRRAFPGVRDVDDVVQESYLRIWRKRTSRPLGSARAFLFRVARNFAIDLLRKSAAPRIAAPPEVIDDGDGPREDTCHREHEDILVEALERLAPRHRQVLTLCKLQGKSSREVAELLQISEKTVNEHLYRGLQRLGEELRLRGVDSAKG